MQQNHFTYAGFREKILDVIMQDVQTKPGQTHMAEKVSTVWSTTLWDFKIHLFSATKGKIHIFSSVEMLDMFCVFFYFFPK